MTEEAASNLSQDEIAERLLSAAGIELEKLPMLRVLLERSAARFAQGLRTLSRAPLRIEIGDIRSGEAGEAVDECGNGLAALMQAQGWDATLLAAVPRASAFGLLEALMGGDGTEAPYEAERDFSRIEQAVVAAVFRQLAEALQAGFSQLTDKVEAKPFAGEIDLDPVGGRDAAAVLIDFRIEVFQRSLPVHAAIPQTALNRVREQLRQTLAGQTPAPSPGWTRHLGKELQRTAVRLRATLDGGETTLGDISRLKVGQVLELTSTPDTPVKVECNAMPLLWSRLGQAEGAFILRVEAFIDQEQDFMNELLGG